MKLLILTSMLVPLLLPRMVQAEDWRLVYDGLLQKYVASDGVKYEDWHGHTEDRKALKTVVDAIAGEDLSKLEKDDHLAFYLNAYNAWILYRILDDYPTKGPGGGGLFGRNRFFKAQVLNVAGKTTSFHLLENEIIRPGFKEPRIHFALNCASASCPPLHTRAFTGADLDETLQMLARTFLHDTVRGVTPAGHTVRVSKIFDWYAEDFQPDVLTYVNTFREKPLSTDAKVKFHSYHWTLNEAGK